LAEAKKAHKQANLMAETDEALVAMKGAMLRV